MKRKADHIREAMACLLSAEDRLRSVAQLHSGSMTIFLLAIQLGALRALLFPISFWYGGVTDRHLILLPIDRTSGKPQFDQAGMFPLNAVRTAGDRIIVNLPNTLKPVNLRVMNLSKTLSGLDAAEFMAAVRGR